MRSASQTPYSTEPFPRLFKRSLTPTTSLLYLLLYLPFLSLWETGWLCLLVAKRNFPRLPGREQWWVQAGISGVITLPGLSNENRKVFHCLSFPTSVQCICALALRRTLITYAQVLSRKRGLDPKCLGDCIKCRRASRAGQWLP